MLLGVVWAPTRAGLPESRKTYPSGQKKYGTTVVPVKPGFSLDAGESTEPPCLHRREDFKQILAGSKKVAVGHA